MGNFYSFARNEYKEIYIHNVARRYKKRYLIHQSKPNKQSELKSGFFYELGKSSLGIREKPIKFPLYNYSQTK